MSTSSKAKSTVNPAAAPLKGKGMSGTNPDDGSIKYGTGGGGQPPRGQAPTVPAAGTGKKPAKG